MDVERLEDPTEDLEAAETPAAPFAEEAAGPPEPPPARGDSRMGRAVRSALRWIAGVLLVFGLGLLVGVLAFRLPVVRSLEQTRAELNQAQQRITEIEGRLERLAELEAENATLKEELNSANLHIEILSALADVNAARLALVLEDPGSARLALTNAPDALDRLADLVGPEQADLVSNMISRLELALDGLETDPFAAQADLEVLANNLIRLENTFFVGP